VTAQYDSETRALIKSGKAYVWQGVLFDIDGDPLRKVENTPRAETAWLAHYGDVLEKERQAAVDEAHFAALAKSVPDREMSAYYASRAAEAGEIASKGIAVEPRPWPYKPVPRQAAVKSAAPSSGNSINPGRAVTDNPEHAALIAGRQQADALDLKAKEWRAAASRTADQDLSRYYTARSNEATVKAGEARKAAEERWRDHLKRLADGGQTARAERDATAAKLDRMAGE
jgi:hypothetical protein